MLKCVALLAATAVSAPAFGQITYFSRVSSIQAYAGDGGALASDSYNGFLEYNNSVAVGPGLSAFQRSLLAPDQIYFEYAADATAAGNSGYATSNIDLIFNLATASEALLLGQLNNASGGFFDITLTSLETNEVIFHALFANADMPVIGGQPLAAGSYHLEVNAGALAHGAASGGILVTIPAPASLALLGATPLALRRRRAPLPC